VTTGVRNGIKLNCWTYFVVYCWIETHLTDNHDGVGMCGSHHGKAGAHSRKCGAPQEQMEVIQENMGAIQERMEAKMDTAVSTSQEAMKAIEE
jgi:hypothetical protein